MAWKQRNGEHHQMPRKSPGQVPFPLSRRISDVRFRRLPELALVRTRSINLFIAPQESDKSEHSDKQHAHAVVPGGSYGDDVLSKENQNIHKARGNCPTSRPGFSLPNSPCSYSRNGAHVNRESRSDEHISENWKCVKSRNGVQNVRQGHQECSNKTPEHELSEVCRPPPPVRPTPLRRPLPFDDGFVRREHGIHEPNCDTETGLDAESEQPATPLGRVVARLDRKCLGQESIRGARSRFEAFSISRLEGSRWRLRQTR
jgi:hypothetical protein